MTHHHVGTPTPANATPLNCRRFFGPGVHRQSAIFGGTTAIETCEQDQLPDGKREHRKRNRRYNNSVMGMPKLQSKEEQLQRLKLPELESMIRKDKIAQSICE